MCVSGGGVRKAGIEVGKDGRRDGEMKVEGGLEGADGVNEQRDM
jgi:hypothetical protein